MNKPQVVVDLVSDSEDGLIPEPPFSDKPLVYLFPSWRIKMHEPLILHAAKGVLEGKVPSTRLELWKRGKGQTLAFNRGHVDYYFSESDSDQLREILDPLLDDFGYEGMRRYDLLEGVLVPCAVALLISVRADIGFDHAMDHLMRPRRTQRELRREWRSAGLTRTLGNWSPPSLCSGSDEEDGSEYGE